MWIRTFKLYKDKWNILITDYRLHFVIYFRYCDSLSIYCSTMVLLLVIILFIQGKQSPKRSNCLNNHSNFFCKHILACATLIHYHLPLKPLFLPWYLWFNHITDIFSIQPQTHHFGKFLRLVVRNQELGVHSTITVFSNIQ